MIAQPGNKTPSARPLHRAVWWGLFLVATYVMSLWFQAFRVFTVAPTLENALGVLAVMAMLGLVLSVLVYDSYVHEKNQGKIAKTIRLFEWLYEKRFLMPRTGETQGDDR